MGIMLDGSADAFAALGGATRGWCLMRMALSEGNRKEGLGAFGARGKSLSPWRASEGGAWGGNPASA